MVSLGPKVSFVSTTLTYPIFAAEFDPYTRGYLIVGGGGGESRSGVPNQISVLDVSNLATITTTVDIELSRDEDSVQSLGSLATRDGLITLAGINSSQKDQNANNNEHFRAFEVKLPPRKRQKTGEEPEKGQATLLGKRSIFKPLKVEKKEAYQRILRLSPAQRKENGSKRIGAVVSGMSKPSEIVVFSATAALPEPADILTRIETEKDDEVLDLDIAVADQDRFSVTWCTDHDIYEQTLEYNFNTKKVVKTPKGPRKIHQIALPAGATPGTARPRFRCLRFLGSENVLALVNRAGKQGSELHIYHLYPTGPASTVLQMSLPRHIKQAVSMDVCVLDADSSGDRQIAVAVAGQDISLETYVINYKASSGTFGRFESFQSLKEVHKHQMTKICFSPFHPPASTEKEQEQNLRLASVSYGNSVVIDAFPLEVLKTKTSKRHVLVHPSSKRNRQMLYVALLSFMVLVAAYLGQAYLTGEADIRADLKEFWDDTYSEVFEQPASTVQDIAQQMQASASSMLEAVPTSSILLDVQSSASSVIETTLPTEIPGVQRLQEVLDLHPEESKAVVVSDAPDGDIALDVHHDKEDFLQNNEEAVHWDDLHEDQKHYWRQKLLQAGRWAEHEGETVLKGVLWSQYAGIVGAAAGEILREL